MEATRPAQPVACRVENGTATIAGSAQGAGPPILLLHGWACNRHFWEWQAEILERSHRVVTIDFRGHGASGMPASGYSLPRLAEDVCEVIRDLGLGPVVVAGHSMGGMVAQQLAACHPEEMKGLILVATTAADPQGTLLSGRIADDAVDLGYRAEARILSDAMFRTRTSRVEPDVARPWRDSELREGLRRSRHRPDWAVPAGSHALGRAVPALPATNQGGVPWMCTKRLPCARACASSRTGTWRRRCWRGSSKALAWRPLPGTGRNGASS